MRIDAIDLFGPLYVNGVVGSEGQILGFSGSQVTWITASGSGSGTVGPQGPTGASYPVQSGRIVFGDTFGTGLTASPNFCYVLGSNILVHHNVAPSIINSTNGTMLAVSGGVMCDGTNTSILASKDSEICVGQYSSIIGGELNDLGYNGGVNTSERSSIIGGCQNQQYGRHIQTSIVGGHLNCIVWDTSSHQNMSSILGGKCNTILSSNSHYKNNTIVGGYCNCLSSNAGSILGGQCNFIAGNAGGGYAINYSAILGGSSLYMCSCSSGPTINGSVIIGGKSSTGLLTDKCVMLDRPFSVIIGGTDTNSGYGGPFSSFYDCSLFVNCLRIDKLLKFKCHISAYDLTNILNAPAGTLLQAPKSGGGSNYFYFNVFAAANKLCFCPN